MRSERYAKVIKELESRVIMPERPPSLETTKKGLERIGFFNFPLAKTLATDPNRAVIVAGTNGKGSVCATLEALFSSAGERVGLYTSPHLMESTERIRIGQKDISQEIFSDAFDFVHKATSDLQLSHFETVTLMAIWCFGSGTPVPPVDRLVLEVGLGGTWDSTNAIPHRACIITRLGFDHQNILGRRLADIAENKFGVVSHGALVVYAPFDTALRDLALRKQTETESKWIEAKAFPLKVESGGPVGDPIYELQTPWGNLISPLPGWRGSENISLALTLFKNLGFDPKDHLKAVEKVFWPGRMERAEKFKGPGRLYLSGDHNPQGVQSLLALLGDYERKQLHILAGVGSEKDMDGILSPLFELPDTHIYLTETPFRGRKVSEYGKWSAKAAAVEAEPAKALQKMVSNMKDGDMGIVTGSLYLVGLIRQYLNLMQGA